MLCSQYIALIYKKLGILNKKEQIYKYMPSDFIKNINTNKFTFDHLIYFKNNYYHIQCIFCVFFYLLLL